MLQLVIVTIQILRFLIIIEINNKKQLYYIYICESLKKYFLERK
jgi:hypothetical protein